jgi:hypothetical protein
MAAPSVGDRFLLLLYGRAIHRFRGPSTTLALLLLGLSYPVRRGMLSWPQPPAEPWLLAGGLASLAIAVLTWIGPKLAYVQARADHLRVQTPIYRMKVSYRRIQNTRPVDVARMFPPSSLRRHHRLLLEPFYGKTALGVDLRGLPLRPLVLRLFFHPLLFAADQPGLVLVTNDWMALSRQLAAHIDAWRTTNQPRPRGPGIGAAAILGED